MRIAILCHTGAGGSGVLATELALILSKMGHNIHMIGEQPPFRINQNAQASYRKDGIYRDLGDSPPPKTMWGQMVELVRRSFAGRFESAGSPKAQQGNLHFHELLSYDYPLFENAGLMTLRVANTLAQLIEKNGIDIVHAHYAIPHTTAAILARESGLDTRIITTLHGTDVTRVGCDPAFSYTTRHAINKSDAVTAVSNALISEAVRNFGITRPMQVIPNWVDARRFVRSNDPKERSRYAQPDESLIMHVSNFRPVKKSKEVVRIFAKILDQAPARLLLVGEGPEKQDCIDLAVALGVSGRVLSLPPLAAVEKLLGLADVVLLPSETEAFGLVALEGMAAGAITIASNVGGLPEVITHGETGLLFPPSAIDDMASAAIEIIKNPKEAGRLRAAARQAAIERFAPEPIIEQYLRLYQKVLGKVPAAEVMA